MKTTISLLCILSFWTISCSSIKNNGKQKDQNSPQTVSDYRNTHLIIIDQSQNRIARVDLKTQSIIWEWKAATGVPENKVAWFKSITEGKLVYNGKYMLITASGGGVALVRIADKVTVFYAYVGGNTHSAELLPDGNIVAASSTGKRLTLIHTDLKNFPDHVYMKTVVLNDAHNVVWDKQRQVLWSAGTNKLFSYTYNFNCKSPDLILKETINLPGSGVHDLFPVYGEDALWLSTSSKVWKIDMKTKVVKEIAAIPRIKSLDSGPEGFPVIFVQAMDSGRKWYNDKVQDLTNKIIFQIPGLKMYKSRWELKNDFSYPKKDNIKTCK